MLANKWVITWTDGLALSLLFSVKTENGLELAALCIHPFYKRRSGLSAFEEQADQSVSISGAAESAPILRARRHNCTKQRAALLNSKQPKHRRHRYYANTQHRSSLGDGRRGEYERHRAAALTHGAQVSATGLTWLGMYSSTASVGARVSQTFISDSAVSVSRPGFGSLIWKPAGRKLSHPDHHLSSELAGSGFSELLRYWLEGNRVEACARV